MQVGGALSPSAENQQLMTEQDGFGENGGESARSCNSHRGYDQMNEMKKKVAHLWII